MYAQCAYYTYVYTLHYTEQDSYLTHPCLMYTVRCTLYVRVDFFCTVLHFVFAIHHEYSLLNATVSFHFLDIFLYIYIIYTPLYKRKAGFFLHHHRYFAKGSALLVRTVMKEKEKIKRKKNRVRKKRVFRLSIHQSGQQGNTNTNARIHMHRQIYTCNVYNVCTNARRQSRSLTRNRDVSMVEVGQPASSIQRALCVLPYQLLDPRCSCCCSFFHCGWGDSLLRELFPSLHK